MAKYKSLFPMVGTIGGVNFYYLNGELVARTSGGGFNGEAIKTKASMKRVRENGSEFGLCSRVNKVFRQALRPFYINYKFRFFHSRLLGMFTGIKALDTVNIRGARCVSKGLEHEAGKRILENFAYTPECLPRTVLPFNFDMDWMTFTLSIPNFNIKQVSFIQGATHLALQFGVLYFNFETLDYGMHLSEPLVLPKDFSGTRLSFIPTSIPTGLGLPLAVLGVRYYQEVDGQMYLLNAKDGVGISVVSIYN